MSKTRGSSQAKHQVRTFYPLAGSISEYERNITEILSTIQAGSFARVEAIEWMMGQYKSSREFCRKVFDMLKSVGLITIVQKHYQLSAPAQHYLKTRQPEVLVWLFIDRVLGFSQLINVLAERKVIDKSTLLAQWKIEVSVKLPTSQFEHRLIWLRGLSYVDVVARNYFLTERGMKLITEMKQQSAATTEEKQDITHRDLEDRVRFIGEFFEFETTENPSINDVLPSYALKLSEADRRLDCLWVRYIAFGGRIKFPVEIHLGGNLADTIDRLETVSEYVQRAVIITHEDQERKILDRLRVKRSRLLDKLLIVTVEDIYKAAEATNVLKSFTTKLFTD